MAFKEAMEGWKPKYNPWLIAVVVALASFMEVLDTSIANVALPHIAGGLGASQGQSTWVLTTYLVANAIVLPITGWITSVVGRKRFFLICILLFTVTSVLCGIAPSLGFLLFARAIQGACGGGMQPMAQSIMADSFPPRLRGLAFAIFGVTAVVAPALGPTLGGWITDNYTWRWIFLINVPVGLITLALVFVMVEDPPFLRRFKLSQARFDYIGFSMLTLGIAALQIMLDKGQEEDWLGSHFICTLAVISAVCLCFLVLWEWFEKQPIVDVKLYKSFNFASCNLMMFLVGVVAFSLTVLMPQFLQTMMGYTAQKAGIVVSVGAAFVAVTLPIVGALTARVPAKQLLALGWLMSATGLYMSAKLLSLQISFGSAMILMLLQYAPMGFILLPVMTASYIGASPDQSDSISGLINFMRNMGSSVGASITQTVLARRGQFHLERLASHTSSGDVNFVNQVQGAVSALQTQIAGMGVPDAQTSALVQIYQLIMAQAAALSYIDAYALMACVATAMFLFSFLIESNDPKQTEQHAAH